MVQNGRERKNANLEADNNARSRAGTTKCQRIGGSPTDGDRNIKEAVRRDGGEVGDDDDEVLMHAGLLRPMAEGGYLRVPHV